MKNKGFTLIELLAVIVILSVITLITIPMITNVIGESKKKALMSSVQGILDSTNYFTISHEAGVYEFLFDKEHKGSTKKGESLDYRGTIDGEGKLYLDKEGNTSICISNDKYYAYKNYNSGIIVGERKTGNCIIGFDALTNKYVAMLDNGTGNVSNVYSKDEVDNLVSNLTAEITNMKSNIEELQNGLNTLSGVVSSNLVRDWTILLDSMTPTTSTSYNLIDRIDNYKEIKIVWWMGQKIDMQSMVYDCSDISDTIGSSTKDVIVLSNSPGTNPTQYYSVTQLFFSSTSTVNIRAAVKNGYANNITFKIYGR